MKSLLPQIEVPLARFALFLVYFWFGLLKLLGLSPAESLVRTLFEKTIPFLSFDTFYLTFALFEVVIGLLILAKGWERVALRLIAAHLIATLLPLFFLPDVTWQGILVPTLVGQYIIKNILIVSAAVVVGTRLRA